MQHEMTQKFKRVYIYQTLKFDKNAKTQRMRHFVRPKCIAITKFTTCLLVCLFVVKNDSMIDRIDLFKNIIFFWTSNNCNTRWNENCNENIYLKF